MEDCNLTQGINKLFISVLILYGVYNHLKIIKFGKYKIFL